METLGSGDARGRKEKDGRKRLMRNSIRNKDRDR
jgi:hypothetical protein